MRQKCKKIGFWFLTLIAVATCNLHELDPCGPPQRNIRSQSLRPPGSELTRSTLAHISRPITSQPCSSDISDKLNRALHKARDTFMNVSTSITSNRMKQILVQDDTHFENLPYASNADSSTRNTIKDLYALKEHWDKISPSDEGGLSEDLKSLMCSTAFAANNSESIMVTVPVVTDAEFSRTMSSHCTRKRNYKVIRDIVSFLEGFRNQTCVP